jgi:hypothetical protein
MKLQGAALVLPYKEMYVYYYKKNHSKKNSLYLKQKCSGMRLFSVCPYKVMYVYMAELIPTSHRNVGLSFGHTLYI